MADDQQPAQARTNGAMIAWLIAGAIAVVLALGMATTSVHTTNAFGFRIDCGNVLDGIPSTDSVCRDPMQSRLTWSLISGAGGLFGLVIGYSLRPGTERQSVRSTPALGLARYLSPFGVAPPAEPADPRDDGGT